MFELSLSSNGMVCKVVSDTVDGCLTAANALLGMYPASGHIIDSMTGEVLFIVDKGEPTYFAGAVENAILKDITEHDPMMGLALMLGKAMEGADIMSALALCLPDPDEIEAGIVS